VTNAPAYYSMALVNNSKMFLAWPPGTEALAIGKNINFYFESEKCTDLLQHGTCLVGKKILGMAPWHRSFSN
jgi:hypothetical protein